MISINRFAPLVPFVVAALISCERRGSSTAAAVSPVPSADEITAAISASDDFAQWKPAFMKASIAVIRDGTCSLADLHENGGWVKSQKHKSQPIYFTYCGGSHISNRIYVDVSTGRVFK